MKNRLCFIYGIALFLACFCAHASDNSALVSMSVASNASVMPRSVFIQTWTIKNTGTTTWTAGHSYTLNIVGRDSLGAIDMSNNTSSKSYVITALIGSGKSVAPNATATFSVKFIAPEKPGTYTDIFQMNNASSVFFGPQFAVTVNVLHTGSTNQYDRSRAVSYANNYAGVICSDGYFWTNGSDFYHYGTNVSVPTNLIGDDCAHFVSSCIGSQTNERGGGLFIPSRVPPSYGEPGAGRLVNTVLIAPGYAQEVSSLSQMEPGDLVGWNWEGDTDVNNLDHVTLYVGNGLLASHAASCLDTSADTWYQSSESKAVRHLIHIFDAPTINFSRSGNNMVLSWTTNWSSYSLQSSPALGAGSVWTKITTTPKKIGSWNYLTNTMPQKSLFYRLMLPGT